MTGLPLILMVKSVPVNCSNTWYRHALLCQANASMLAALSGLAESRIRDWIH